MNPIYVPLLSALAGALIGSLSSMKLEVLEGERHLILPVDGAGRLACRILSRRVTWSGIRHQSLGQS